MLLQQCLGFAEQLEEIAQLVLEHKVSRPKRFLKGLPCVHLTEFIESARMPVYLLFEQ
jgi:hypothetical protein